MIVTASQQTLRESLLRHKKNGRTIGFVPTMGALHAGHLSLIERIKEYVDIVVVSIFVNPKQFAPHEDLNRYPRTIEKDITALKAQNVSLVYTPHSQDLYPQQFSTHIHTGALGKILEGVARPHFFDGVALVVTKLFNIVQPDYAIFGEKDYQQICIIKQLIQDLNLPIHIISGAIERDESGLALSSRNRYLSENGKRIAPKLHQTLLNVKDSLLQGADITDTLKEGEENLIAKGFESVDYLSLNHAYNLTPLTLLNHPGRLLVAVYLENVRLIDNISVAPKV